MATKSVSNFADLKLAIEDASTTEIIITNNITFTSGAKVNVSKGGVVIDCGGYTITDYNSLSFTDTIYVASTSSVVNVTIKNAVWSGRNYYGVVGVYDGNTNTTITLDNINYVGPQFVYNKYGTTNIDNCTVSLVRNGSSADPQEFCEANRLNISGVVNVNSNATSTAVIWFTNSNSALTIAEGANFTVEAPSTYFLYTDSQPVLTFKKNSVSNITTKNGLFYAQSSTYHIASSFTLEESATFISTQQESNSTPMFKCVSNFTLGQNSVFELYSPSAGTAALMYFANVANVNFNLPKRVVLYNNGGKVFNFQTGSTTSPNVITLQTEMLRLWLVATTPLSNAGGLLDKPSKSFHKLNYLSNISLKITTTNSEIISVDNNLVAGDEGYPLNSASIDLFNASVLSMGWVILNFNSVTDSSMQISGTTEPNANLQVSYNETNLNSTSQASGGFAVSLAEKISKGTTITISSNKKFLTKTSVTNVLGSVSITNVNPLKFYGFAVPANKDTILRIDNDWAVEITDTRDSGADWYLYAYLDKNLTSGNNELENSLVFKENGNISVVSKTPVLIYKGSWENPPKVTKITWDKLEGFLLSINPTKNYPSGFYATELQWEITTILK